MEEKKIDKTIGILNIHSTYNNTIANITDINGNVLCWSSCGTAYHKDNPNKKFRGKAKKTENAAFLAIRTLAGKCYKYGIKQLVVYLKHYGSAIDVFANAIKTKKLKINVIHDKTPLAFNGCRPEKRRRKKRHIKNKDINYVKVRHKKTIHDL